MRIIKRSGRHEEWDSTKIERAVNNAYLEVYPNSTNLPGEECSREVTDQFDMYETPTVEQVQDVVERYLMQLNPDVAREYIRYRYDHELARKLRPDPNLISDYIVASKYAQFNGSRREVWDEIVERYMTMIGARLSKMRVFTKDTHDWARRAIKAKRVVPSMRGLQFAGPAIMKHNARLYNCSFTHVDRPEVFGQSLYLLLCGCGVGYSVQKHHVNKLPDLVKPEPDVIEHHTVGDTIEGWADALTLLVRSYFDSSVGYVEFSYEKIRPLGSPLLTSGGVAPGHVPLKRALERVRAVLDAAGERLTPFEAHRIMCIAAECVLAGGIRRSSLIALFTPSDTEMRTCKEKEFWWRDMPELAMANNSAVFRRDKVTKEEFIGLLQHARAYGEPGFYLTSNIDWGCNPCGEIGLDPLHEGQTGFAFCNLTEVNAAACKDQKEFVAACEVASWLGTVQATFTSFPYLGSVTEEIAKRDALLGVSITGQCDAPWLTPDILSIAADRVRTINESWAQNFGINPAARLTTVKPSGTASLALGCVGSGIHPHHSKRYVRRVTANPNEVPFRFFRKHCPDLCEQKPNGDWVINFPIITDGVTWDDTTALEFMQRVIDVYKSWVRPGTTRGLLTHNVSCTVECEDHEWDDAFEFAWENRHHITAMSFLPRDGDLKYEFAPRQRLRGRADLEWWKGLVSSSNNVDWTQLREDYDSTTLRDTGACEGPTCEI